MEKTSGSSFQDLLLRFSRENDRTRRQEIESELWERFGSTETFLVLDMARYSRTEREHGVVCCLSMIRHLQWIVRPIVEHHGGSIVAFHADNIDARFESPSDAIRASVAINVTLDSENARTPEELNLHVSCGIDHGPCLIQDERHFYGNPVIRASKLGEDFGVAGQILITEEARVLVPDALGLEFEKSIKKIAGVEAAVFSVQYR